MSIELPMTYLEEMMILSDQPHEPCTVHMEYRVEGRLDAERMRAAIIAAMQRHPLARAYLLRPRIFARTRRWHIPDTPLPFELDEVDADDAQIESLRDRLISGYFPLYEATAPFRCMLVHNGNGDRLMMSLSHRNGDGIAQLNLMRSIQRAYAGHVEEARPAAHLLPYRDLRQLVEPVDEMAWQQALEPIRRHKREAADASQLMAPKGGKPDLHEYGVRCLRIDASELQRIQAQRRRGSSLNDVMLAALARTVRRWNQQAGAPTARVGIKFAFNLRPAPWRLEEMGNYAAFVPLTLSEADCDTPDVCLTKVCEWTNEYKTTLGRGALRLSAAVGKLPLLLKNRLIGNMPKRYYDTTALSNLGVFPEAGDFGHEAGRVTEFWFSPPAPSGLGFAVGAISYESELFITMRYRKHRFSPAAAAEMMALYRSCLLSP